MIDNRHEVLAILAEHRSTVRLSLHGHVHANTLAWAHGIPFVSLASTTEFPMQWHELLLHDGNRHGNGSADDAGRPCRVEVRPWHRLHCGDRQRRPPAAAAGDRL